MATQEARKHDESGRKISATFEQRLRSLGPKDRVRAILVMKTPEKESGGSPRSIDRKEQMESVRESVGKALNSVDRVLEEHGGRRESSDIDILGAVPVETTPEGIFALAQSDEVKAILEDQPIHLLLGVKPAVNVAERFSKGQ